MRRAARTAVVLFVYNRPAHAAAVVEGLRHNGVKELYVFADGPKSSYDRQAVNCTRRLVEQVDWCRIRMYSNERNYGLAASIIRGVSHVFNEGYDRVIVLEDDCVPKPGFIQYMMRTLDHYERFDKVMHVSGFGLPLRRRPTAADVYFTPYPCSWGWGTWAKYWRDCDFHQMDAYAKLLENNALRRAFDYAGAAFSTFLSMQLRGEIDSWLIRWYYHIFSRGGRCVWSYDSWIKNCGFDGTGVHKVTFDRYNQFTENYRPKDVTYEDNIQYHPEIIVQFRRFFNGKNPWEKFKSLVYHSTGIILERRIGLGETS